MFIFAAQSIAPFVGDLKVIVSQTSTKQTASNHDRYVTPLMVKEDEKKRSCFIRDKLETSYHETSDRGPSRPSDIELDYAQLSDILPKQSKWSSSLLYGRAGVGKTMLAHWLMGEWCEGRWGTEYTAMFILDVHELGKIETRMTLSDLLVHNSVHKTTQIYPQLPLWLDKNQKQTLIWLGTY